MTTTSTELDTLRAMTKNCLDVWHQTVGIGPCSVCHGRGVVPRFAWLWEECFCRVSPCRQCRIETLRQDHSLACHRCTGTRLVARNPTSDEIEDELNDLVLVKWGIDAYVAIKAYPGKQLLIITELNASPDEWKGEFDYQNEYEGTDPRDCRLQALLALAQGETE